jgi:hypothetical protein
MTLDIQALKAKLREYDKSLPKCPNRIEKIEYRPIYDSLFSPEDDTPLLSYHPCCRPADHEGECQNTRPVLGWPGYDVLKELIEIAERVKNDADQTR